MSIARTYRGRRALCALAAALAIALASVVAAPAAAWASVSDAVLGLNVNVPSTVQQAPGAGGDAGGKGSAGVLGLNLRVPDAQGADPDGGSESAGDRPAAGVLGLNLNVPSTVQQAPGAGGDAGGKGSAGVLGLNLRVPDAQGADPDGGSESAGDRPATGVLGLNLNVPSTVTQAPDAEGEAAGAEGVLGLNLNVPRGNYVAFDANGGQGSWLAPIVPGEPVRAPEGSEGGFFWPARVIEGWYTDPACPDDARWDFSRVPEGAMTLYAHWVLAEEPHPTEAVELHVVYDNVVLDGDGYGVAGYSGPAPGVDGHGPVYTGEYLLGGALPPDLDGTLALPEPEMTPTEDLDGLFDGWYRTCTFDDAGNPTYADEVSRNADGQYAIGRYETGEKVFWAKWRTTRTHQVAFDPGEGAWPDGTTAAQIVRVEHGKSVQAPSPAPELAGHVFVEWRTEEGVRYAFGSPVYEDLRLVAHYEPIPEGTWTVTFDAAGGKWENGPGADDDEAVRVVTVSGGSKLAVPDSPKKAGWQMDPAHDWAREDGTRWDFESDEVDGDVTLKAVWTLRLDVTVPVEVGFAVNADTLEAVGPAADAYALKSRTVRPVAVDSFEAASEQSQLEAFFKPKGDAGWEDALKETSLSLKSAGATDAVVLPLAGAQEGSAWKSVRELDGEEKSAYAMGPFDYGGVAFDEGWEGEDPSERLPIEFGLALSDKLEVRADLDGPKPITRLIVTVSAQG